MLHLAWNETSGIATLTPEGALSSEDFTRVAAGIDGYIERHGQLNGLIIHTQSFPGWDSFSALLSHLKFVKNRHQRIARVALVTDSALGDFAEKVASHFVSAEVRHFDFEELEQATEWLLAAL